MMAVQRTKRRTGETKTGPVGRSARATPAGPDSDARRAEVREFIVAMSVELSELAYKNGLDALAVVFDMAREVAESDLSASDEHLRRP